MFDYFQQNLATTIYCLVAAILVIGAFAYRSTLEFWLNHWKYTFPGIGKTARLARDGIQAKGGWTDSERTLCGDYNKFISYLTREEFNKRNEYLAKADDSGRSPTPIWLFALLTILVIAEGLGFSYLLGSWMSRDGSANTHTLLMIAIVFVLCVIMVFITHVAGHQLYRSNLVTRCRRQWKQDRRPVRGDGLQTDTQRLSTKKIKLDDDQSIDDKEPDYTQVVNRVGTHHSYFMVGLAVVVIVLIAVTSTWMRMSNLNAEQTREVVGQSQSSDGGNPFASANALPTELTSSQQAVDAKAHVEEASSTRSEGIAAFITLAVIFVVTQIVGIYGGYAWGFGGKESKSAFRTTKGFTTFEDYNTYFAPFRTIAQSQLENLQKMLGENVDIAGVSFDKSFRDYVIEQRQIHDGDLAPGAFKSAENVAPGNVKTEPPITAEHPLQANFNLTATVQSIEAQTDVEEKKRIILGLDKETQSRVVAELKRRKEAGDAERSRMSSELDSLFGA
jgi:hypothetical protein